MVAAKAMAVLLLLRVLLTTKPPEGVRVMPVAALGAVRSRTRVGPVLLTLLPAASNNSTLNTPPLAMAVCSSALVGVPSLVVRLTLVSPAAMSLSWPMRVSPNLNTAEPPVAWPAVMLAAKAKAVLLLLRVLATTWPPAGVMLRPVAALGATMSRTRVGPLVVTWLPATSNSLTLTTPPVAMAVCKAAALAVLVDALTLVSLALMRLSVATNTPLT